MATKLYVSQHSRFETDVYNALYARVDTTQYCLNARLFVYGTTASAPLVYTLCIHTLLSVYVYLFSGVNTSLSHTFCAHNIIGSLNLALHTRIFGW